MATVRETDLSVSVIVPLNFKLWLQRGVRIKRWLTNDLQTKVKGQQ